MKKIAASVGLVALGASTLHAAYMPSAPTGGKPWGVSATLRGFYDDNPNTVSDNASKNGSFGFEISPSATYALTLDTTTFSAGYTFSGKYYEKQLAGPDTGHWDKTHLFNAALDHAFSERYSISLSESFVVGQEPDTIGYNVINAPQHISGDNIRNYAAITFDAKLTRLFGLQIGYDNSFNDYASTLEDLQAVNPPILGPSRSGTLDRIEHNIHVDGRWQALPQTTAILGAAFGLTDYTADEQINTTTNLPDQVFSKARNSRAYSGYVGVDHNFRPDLSGSIRVGAQLFDFYNHSNSKNDVTPYAKGNLQYTYKEGSYVNAGFSYSRGATDLTGFMVTTNGGISRITFTTDASYATLFATVRHQIIPKFFGSLSGQMQHAEFNGGSLDGETEKFYLVGLNFEYQFNHYFSANAGYDFDKLDSSNGRSYDRNRVYIGVTAKY